MMAPLPNCFSIWPTASSTAFAFSRSIRSSLSDLSALSNRSTEAGGMAVLLGGAVILRPCRAKVNGNSVNGACEHIYQQRLMDAGTFAPEFRIGRICHHTGHNAESNWPCLG